MDKNQNSGVYLEYTVSAGITALLLLLLSGAAHAFSNSSSEYEMSSLINSCTAISSPGTYVLDQNIINSSESKCIEITSSDVVFDGAGYTIDGIDYESTYGIYVYRPITLTNVTVKNVKVTDWSYGISYKNTIYGNIINNIADSNSNGIYLSSSGTNTLTNNTANSNSNGIYLYDSKGNTLTINIANLNSNGIYLSSSNTNTLTYNKADSNREGIYLEGSNFNTINSNSANSNNNGNGIELSNSDSNTITSNTAILNSDTGFLLRYSDANTFSGNTANLNSNNGYALVESEDLIFTKNSATMNSNNGFYFFYSTGNTLTGNNITLNGNHGIDFTINNNIYNNFFNNIHNVGLSNDIGYWNTTKQAGINIIGGPYIGGNFWAQPNGKGFSQTCTDEDRDGICDSSFVLNTKNVDYLPLTFIPDVEPPKSVIDLKNISYAPDYINWTWTDPMDSNFSYVMVYLDSSFQTNVSKWVQHYNATGLIPGTMHTIATRTVDLYGNINQLWVNHTAMTQSSGEMKGDVNRNGRRETGDATLILRSIVGLPVPSQYQPVLPIGDMNCNNRIDTGDATLVLRDVVGLSLPRCWV